MELAPRYCRSCGSRILVKNVCHNCNSDPLKGDNYCYDCGSLTPNPDSCLKCGARYKVKSPVKLLLMVGSLLIVAIAVAGYFISRPAEPASASQPENAIVDPENSQQELAQTQDTIVNKPAIDTSVLINKPVVTKPADTIAAKTPVADTAKKTGLSVITLEERKAYPVKCTYFSKNQRGRVLFFIAGGSAYIKMNEQIVELRRKRKGVDVAVFGNGQYDATISIDGLSGSAKEWLASCTLTIKDLTRNTTVRHKVYSSCIEL